MTQVRFGVIGYGNIGRTHVQTLLSGAVNKAVVTAVVARPGTSLPDGVTLFENADALLASDAVDAVIVATPTMNHARLGRAVLAAGKHLVMEKPIANSAGQGAELVAAVPEGTVAAVMLNQRYHPAYRKIQQTVASGQLGKLVRFNWLMTAWYRPDVYFAVSAWRGTWPGEGGGALMNQCIHNLDVLQWILGMPASVVAQAQFGKFHNIDVEDEVSALFTYADGLTGSLIASTGEAPGINRLDIVGDRASLQFDGESLHLHSADQSVSEHCATTTQMFGVPQFSTAVLPTDSNPNQHASVLQDVVDAIVTDATLATPLAAGLPSIELANAMLLSAWQQRWVSLPLDANAYQQQLDARMARSGLRQPANVEVQIDMDASYR